MVVNGKSMHMFSGLCVCVIEFRYFGLSLVFYFFRFFRNTKIVYVVSILLCGMIQSLDEYEAGGRRQDCGCR